MIARARQTTGRCAACGGLVAVLGSGPSAIVALIGKWEATHPACVVPRSRSYARQRSRSRAPARPSVAFKW